MDARGQRCPLPVIALARAAAQAGSGAVVELLATDPATRHDVPAWCRMRGQRLLEATSWPAHDDNDNDNDGGGGGGGSAAEVLRFLVQVS